MSIGDECAGAAGCGAAPPAGGAAPPPAPPARGSSSGKLAQPAAAREGTLYLLFGAGRVYTQARAISGVQRMRARELVPGPGSS